MDLYNVVAKVLKLPIMVGLSKKYQNTFTLSGWILRKPKIIKNDITGVESCSLLLYQFTQGADKVDFQVFSCMVYVKDLVDQLKTLDKVCFVHTLGKMCYSKKVKGMYGQITYMETAMELDIDLAIVEDREKQE